ncbi:MAG TPA: hypothetical protein VFS19_03925 [Planctomycetota bacterium]|nr:hypothetical protein [Planctomycetota bacterium]
MTSVVVLILAAAMPQDQDGERLRRFENSFKKSDSSSSSKPKKEKSDWPQEDDDDDSWDVIDVILDGVFGYPFRDFNLRFDDYPYAHGRRYFLGPRPRDVDKSHASHDKEIAFEAGLEFGRVEHDLTYLGIRGGMRVPSGCDISFDLSQYREDVDGGTDRLTFHQYHLNIGGRGWELGRSYQFSGGFGVGFLNGDGGVSDAGFSIRAALLLYPKEPFSLRFSASITFFEHAALNDFRGEVGFHIGRFALLGGVRSLISSEEGGDLTGPTLGVMVFF